MKISKGYKVNFTFCNTLFLFHDEEKRTHCGLGVCFPCMQCKGAFTVNGVSQSAIRFGNLLPSWFARDIDCFILIYKKH